MKVNLRKASVHKADGVFAYKPWMKIQVGDVVKLEKDQFFPADLLLLSSSYEDGICYVETVNLDGETNLKVKRSLEVTLPLDDDEAFKNFAGTVTCEDPNPHSLRSLPIGRSDGAAAFPPELHRRLCISPVGLIWSSSSV
ncbi:hypothetical protein POM88_007206 [Heracleum sosnowskyi]|uniref:Uncharacterized protein n=2 Tax=Heracleum sosnowskyi TaxID=360622 RepID=A0AAD8J4Z4_9APIA|nr:hypothetical protein POM88_007206 [Heracleum sosnowskyi]